MKAVIILNKKQETTLLIKFLKKKHFKNLCKEWTVYSAKEVKVNANIIKNRINSISS